MNKCERIPLTNFVNKSTNDFIYLVESFAFNSRARLSEWMLEIPWTFYNSVEAYSLSANIEKKKHNISKANT